MIATAVVALTVAARADDKPKVPFGYVTCSIIGHCLTWDGQWTQRVPVPRPRPKMEIPATETGKG